MKLQEKRLSQREGKLATTATNHKSSLSKGAIMKASIQTLIVLTAILLVAAPQTAWSDAPGLMNYQGRLTDTAGLALSGSYSIQFTIYDDPAAGSVVWQETHPTVSVNNGLFNVSLGSITTLSEAEFADTSRWLGIKVGADPEIVPRSRLVTAPYAFRVATVDGATGGTISGDVAIQSDLTVSGKATIGPSHTNIGAFAFVAGEFNYASGDNSFVGGGTRDSAFGEHSVIGGGTDNVSTIGATYAFIGAGDNNTASGGLTVVAGGRSNTASENRAVVSGGQSNVASGGSSAIGGGWGNAVSGNYSTIPGGEFNSATSNYSFAAGRYAKADHPGTFVWSDNRAADFASTAQRQFLIEAEGGVGIGTNSPSEQLDVAGTAKMNGFMMPTGATDSYVLTSDATGVGTWQQAPGGGGGPYGWQDDGTVVRLDASADSVGIGTNTPKEKLHVANGRLLMGNSVFAKGSGQVGDIILESGSGNVPGVIFYHGNNKNFGIDALVDGTGGMLRFVEEIGESGATQMVLRKGGNVGIGTMFPSDRLTVNGVIRSVTGGFKFPDNTVQISAATGGGWTDDGAVVRLDASADSVGIGTSSPTEKLDVVGNIHASGIIQSGSSISIDGATDKITASSGKINFEDDTLVTSGAVGIGTVSPAQQLDVNGTVQATGFKMPTGAANNYVLTSNASGVGTWQASGGGGGGGGWTDDGTVVRLDSTADWVGIGTSTPTEKLDVVGNIVVSGKATIGPGHTNTGTNAFVVGSNNEVSGDGAAIGGGSNNRARGIYSVVSGGGGPSVLDSNAAIGVLSTVGGGKINIAAGDNSTVGGGLGNDAIGNSSTISGGWDNSATGGSSTVAGGADNIASNSFASIGGGQDNQANGYGATVPGGRLNTANSDYSFAAGRQAKANHIGTFVWADSEPWDHSSTGPNQFLIRAAGGVDIEGDLTVSGDISGNNDPGLAHSRVAGATINSSGATPIDSVTITPPAAGYVMIVASWSGYVMDHNSGSRDAFRFSLSATLAHDPLHLSLWAVPEDQPSFVHSNDGYNGAQTLTAVVPAVAGVPLKYYLLGDRALGGESYQVLYVNITAMYFPTSYGSVD